MRPGKRRNRNRVAGRWSNLLGQNTGWQGRIRIQTADPEALKAVHEFLRFQIEDHHTGDSQDIA